MKNWQIDENNCYGVGNEKVYGVKDSEGIMIANCGTVGVSEHSKNAALVAAAPMLLNLLIQLHAESQHYLDSGVGGGFLQDVLNKVHPIVKQITNERTKK